MTEGEMGSERRFWFAVGFALPVVAFAVISSLPPATSLLDWLWLVPVGLFAGAIGMFIVGIPGLVAAALVVPLVEKLRK